MDNNPLIYITGSASSFANPAVQDILNRLTTFQIVRSDEIGDGDRFEMMGTCGKVLILADKEWVESPSGQAEFRYAQGLPSPDGKTTPKPLRCFVYPLAELEILESSFLGKEPDVYWISRVPFDAVSSIRAGGRLTLRQALRILPVEYKNMPDPDLINKHLGMFHSGEHDSSAFGTTGDLMFLYTRWLIDHPFPADLAQDLINQDIRDYLFGTGTRKLADFPRDIPKGKLHGFAFETMYMSDSFMEKIRMPRWTDDNPHILKYKRFKSIDQKPRIAADIFSDISGFGFAELYWHLRWFLTVNRLTMPYNHVTVLDSYISHSLDVIQMVAQRSRLEDADDTEKAMHYYTVRFYEEIYSLAS